MPTRPYDVPGVWMRGNMHTHTTESDGRVTPQEAIDGFAAEGYDFLSLTDHERVTDPAPYDARGMTMLPGTEIAVGHVALGRPYHLVGIGLPGLPDFDSEDAQAALDALASASQFTFIAHPSWSDVSFPDLLALEGADAVEVFNTGCHREMGRGVDEVPWDDCLARGHRLLAVAVDDCHWKVPDMYGGWVMVRAADRSADAVYEALRAGRYYSSTGPIIEELEIHADRIHVRCSPVAEVFAVSPLPGHGATSWLTGQFGEPITECELPFEAGTSPVRVTLVDAAGNRAWTNPFWPDEIDL